MNIIIHTDGGSRGNPGPAAIGALIEFGNSIHEISNFIGNATNNIAEYKAVLEALSFIENNLSKFNDYKEINLYADSSLVINQLNGKFRIKDAKLREIYASIKFLEASLSNMQINYRYIPRDQNTKADCLVNRALDNELYFH